MIRRIRKPRKDRAPARDRRRLRRSGPGVLAVVATLFVASALTRLAGTPAEESRELWHAFSAWAQSAESRQREADPTGAPVQDDADVLLAALLARDAALVAREREIESRERALALAEEELSAGLAAFEEAEAALRQTIALADGAAQADLDRLTRMYETMKPKDAAALFETMDPTFAAGFLGQMSPAAAAEILSGLTPEVAYSVSLVLAGRNMRVQ